MVDQKLLETTLNLGNRARIGHGRCRGSHWSRRSVAWGCELLVDWADWAGLLILNGSRLWHDWLLVFNSDLEAKLKLGLCGTI
jgi:hypothetical protein